MTAIGKLPLGDSHLVVRELIEYFLRGRMKVVNPRDRYEPTRKVRRPTACGDIDAVANRELTAG